jgi:hypothetical protein
VTDSLLGFRLLEGGRAGRDLTSAERMTPVKPLIAILALIVAALPVAALAWAPDAGQQRLLVGGRTVSEVSAVDDGAGLIHAAIDIAAPPKVVWSVMNDCRYIRKLITSAVDCRILQGDAGAGGWDVRETVTKGSFFVPSIHNVYRSDYQPYSLIRFRKAGGDLKVEEGEWRLEALNGGTGTRVIYVNRVAANILAPASLVREGMRKDTAKVLVNLRRESLSVAR